MTSLPMLALLLAMVAIAGCDAIKDKTPRRPWKWARPELEWWAERKTSRERKRSTIAMASEK